MDDLISRHEALEELEDWERCYTWDEHCRESNEDYIVSPSKVIAKLPSAQPEQQRTFIELVVEYPEPELCTYKEYKGKPYYSIKYIENGETYIGYGTYNPKVLSQYLSEYFISSAQPVIIRCKDCLMHGVCRFEQGLGLDGYCSKAERRTDG